MGEKMTDEQVYVELERIDPLFGFRWRTLFDRDQGEKSALRLLAESQKALGEIVEKIETMLAESRNEQDVDGLRCSISVLQIARNALDHKEEKYGERWRDE